MIVGAWVCIWDLPKDSSYTISELCSNPKALGPDLCPKYKKEHGRNSPHRL